jgi:hypothetical protein
MDSTLISVLLPTRNRTALAKRSVTSLLSLCADPTQVEIVVAFDEDDLDSAEFFQSLQWHSFIKDTGAQSQICCCPAWGYSGLNHYYTAMAKQSQGRWFMIWNDDAVMRTAGWDQHVADHKDFVGMLHMATENFKPTLTLFPLIPQVWMDLFGEISQHQLNDSWIQDICHEADAVQKIPVTVFHDRYDVTGNNFDSTYANRRYNKKLYNHEDTKKIRSAWALRLKEYREQTVACEPTLLQT